MKLILFPFEALMDAKSPMPYIRAHAEEFIIDANRIIASGGYGYERIGGVQGFLSLAQYQQGSASHHCFPGNGSSSYSSGNGKIL
jgi:hypothetical protein